MHLVENLGSVMVCAYECVHDMLHSWTVCFKHFFKNFIDIIKNDALFKSCIFAHLCHYEFTGFFTDDTNMTLKKLLIFKVVF